MNSPYITTREILAARGPKNRVSVDQPYGFFVEHELSAQGSVDDVAVILLTNRECPFRCLMCDLWQNTVDERVPAGSITRQIDYALERLPPVQHVKLYNSGNFFDPQAIPPEEYSQIAKRVNRMATVIVENHPRYCREPCLRFRDLLSASSELEIAIGLETAHPELLARLNKHMTCDDFQRAVEYLGRAGIPTRAFILLRPPYQDEASALEWALRSVEFAFSTGVRCCCLIPTRDGNGIMERLRGERLFAPPRLTSLETVVETAVGWRRGRVLADLWDAKRLAGCPECSTARIVRLREMNLTQTVPPPVSCHCQATT